MLKFTRNSRFARKRVDFATPFKSCIKCHLYIDSIRFCISNHANYEILSSSCCQIMPSLILLSDIGLSYRQIGGE